MPTVLLLVPTAVITGLGLPEQILVSAIAAKVPVAMRSVTESVFVQPSALVTLTTYLLLSTVGVTVGAAAVDENPPGPVHTYVFAALGEPFKTIEPPVHKVVEGGAGKLTLG